MATGGGTYYIHQQKIARKAQVAEARSAMISLQAAKNNITLLPETRFVLSQLIPSGRRKATLLSEKSP